jgi:hypothetical protein
VEAENHRGPALGAGPGDDRAFLRGGQPADDVKADPDTAEPPPVARFALDEALEDPLVVAWRDADALVQDGDLDQRPFHGGPHGHPAARRRVLEGVLQELAHDDVGRHRVAEGERQVIGDFGDDLVLIRQRAERHHRRPQQRGQVERGVGDRQLVGPGPRTEQELLDQPAERSGPLCDGAHRGPPVGVGQLVPARGERGREPLHDRDRGAQLVARGGEEQVLGLLKLLGRGHVTEVHHPFVPVAERRAQHVNPASARQLVGPPGPGLGQRERQPVR